MNFIWFTRIFLKMQPKYKYKRKEVKRLRETTQEGDMFGIVSRRSPSGRFWCLERKHRFIPKSTDVKGSFFPKRSGLPGANSCSPIQRRRTAGCSWLSRPAWAETPRQPGRYGEHIAGWTPTLPGSMIGWWQPEPARWLFWLFAPRSRLRALRFLRRASTPRTHLVVSTKTSA